MEQLLDPKFLWSQLDALRQMAGRQLLNADTLLETGLMLTGILTARLAARPLAKRMATFIEERQWDQRLPGSLFKAIGPVLTGVLAIFFLRIGAVALGRFEVSTFLVDTGIRLLSAWVLIRLTTALLKDSNWARLLSTLVWIIAALHILKLLVPTIAFFDQLAVNLGGVRISLLLLIKGVIVFTILLRLATGLSNLLEKRIYSLTELTPSVQVLLSKALKITFLAVAVIVALGSLGINLSAFAFIGGAIGVGVGFGLQKVVSNLVSGVILLLDRSIKPGDVIAVGDTYGRIQSLGARYVSVATRDRTEYLIPNEDLITTQVVNWSFSDRLVRLKLGVGVSYASDIHQVMALVIEATADIPRVLNHPKPVCLLKDFGESSVDMELRFWISDPENGIANVSSAVRVAIWDSFKANDIEIPFPQRDVHLKQSTA